mmetsp:Transcript_16597/g.47249  ORF Transcript_16597/g.47249 Transcript_16597/m.47249 type:complete len:248 (-) Transcript_16597:228-971(-)
MRFDSAWRWEMPMAARSICKLLLLNARDASGTTNSDSCRARSTLTAWEASARRLYFSRALPVLQAETPETATTNTRPHGIGMCLSSCVPCTYRKTERYPAFAIVMAAWSCEPPLVPTRLLLSILPRSSAESAGDPATCLARMAATPQMMALLLLSPAFCGRSAASAIVSGGMASPRCIAKKFTTAVTYFAQPLLFAASSTLAVQSVRAYSRRSGAPRLTTTSLASSRGEATKTRPRSMAQTMLRPRA